MATKNHADMLSIVQAMAQKLDNLSNGFTSSTSNVTELAAAVEKMAQLSNDTKCTLQHLMERPTTTEAWTQTNDQKLTQTCLALNSKPRYHGILSKVTEASDLPMLLSHGPQAINGPSQAHSKKRPGTSDCEEHLTEDSISYAYNSSDDDVEDSVSRRVARRVERHRYMRLRLNGPRGTPKLGHHEQ